MIVCVTCNRVMVPPNDTSTAWIKQTKKEHPCTIVRCPLCGTVVADVNRGIERHAEEPWPGDLALDLPHDLELL
jgi:hypothetical protein